MSCSQYDYWMAFTLALVSTVELGYIALYTIALIASLLRPSSQSSPQRVFLKALPKVNRPKMEIRLSTAGTGFPLRMARGMEAAPRTIEARRASSTP